MNFFAILNQLAEVDPELPGRFDARRAVFRRLGAGLGRAAQAAAPVLLAGLFQRAYAGSAATDPLEVLNYALQYETLVADFYGRLLGTGLVPAGSAALGLNKIKQHEDAHVALLRQVIGALGGAAATGRQFRQSVFDANRAYAPLLTVAQLLEDLGVRAYKGRVVDLQGLAAVNVPGRGAVSLLNTALQLHAVEARHAAFIRLQRSQTPWVSSSLEALATNAVYTGALPESNTIQSNVEVTGGLGTFYGADVGSAAFDEPLTRDEVLDASRLGSFTQ